LTAGPAREQHIGDVGRSNQQNEENRAEQHQYRQLEVPDDLLLQGNEPHRMIHIGRWILCSQRASDRIDIGLRLLARHARLQARHDVEVVTVTIIETEAVRDGNPKFIVTLKVKQIRDVWTEADSGKSLNVT